MGVGYFRIDFQVNHRFRHTRIGPIIFVFITRSGNGRARNIMRSTFLSAKEYRDFAAQCLRWASRAKREEHKNMMLQMADHWMQTAQTMERIDTRVPSGARLASTPTPQDDARQKPLQDDFKGAESMISFLPGRSTCAQERARPVQSNSGPSFAVDCADTRSITTAAGRAAPHG